MKKGIYLAVAAVMMTGCLTGCGESSKRGASSMEKAAEAYITAIVNNDVEAYIALMPEEIMGRFEDECYFSETQIMDIAKKCLEEWAEKLDDKDIKQLKKSKIEDSHEAELDEIQQLNEGLGVIRAEEVYLLSFDCDFECSVFKYDERWYSCDVISDISDMIVEILTDNPIRDMIENPPEDLFDDDDDFFDEDSIDEDFFDNDDWLDSFIMY